QCATSNLCLLQNDLDFPVLIAHCSLLISGVRFSGSMREMLRGILSSRCWIGNVNGAGRAIQGQGPCFFHTLRKLLHRVRMSVRVGPWPALGLPVLASACVPCALGGPTDAGTNEFMAEAPEIWVRSVELRAAIGYKDNLLLGRTPTERSVLIGSGADLTLARLPLDGKQLSFLLSADDTRYLQGHAVDHEDLVVALAQVKVDLSSAWRLG